MSEICNAGKSYGLTVRVPRETFTQTRGEAARQSPPLALQELHRNIYPSTLSTLRPAVPSLWPLFHFWKATGSVRSHEPLPRMAWHFRDSPQVPVVRTSMRGAGLRQWAALPGVPGEGVVFWTCLTSWAVRSP